MQASCSCGRDTHTNVSISNEIAICVGLLALIVWFVFFLGHRSSKTFGSGILTDNGLFAFSPRYKLRFEEFSLDQPKSVHRYRFRQLPRIPITLRLDHQHASTPPEQCTMECAYSEALEQAKTRVKVTLFKNGLVYFYTLKDPLIGIWTLSTSYFWHDERFNLDLSQKAEYEMKLEVESEQPPSLEIKLQPVLVGEGCTALDIPVLLQFILSSVWIR